MNKTIIAGALLFLLVGWYIGIWTGLKITESGMMRQSLKGYRAIATYQTNSFGEITIKNIEWKLP